MKRYNKQQVMKDAHRLYNPKIRKQSQWQSQLQ